MFYFPNEQWYAIRVKYRQEHIAEKALESKNFSPLCLTYQEKSKRKDRYKILTKFFFPGYMFIKVALNAERHVELLQSQGVVEILRNSSGPIPIHEDQIANVMKLKDYSGEILQFTEFCQGMLVRIIHGPLTGLIGRIDEVQRGLLKIHIESVPGSVAIQVPTTQLEPVETKYSLSDLLRMNTA